MRTELKTADEFEFERLTQSFWWKIISNVSSSKSSQPLMDVFPMKAQDTRFMRPKENYICDDPKKCEMRTPKKLC